MGVRTGRRFARFAASSLVSAAVDQAMAFVLFGSLEALMGDDSYLRVLIATLVARVCAVTLNYLINQRFVFVGEPRSGVVAGSDERGDAGSGGVAGEDSVEGVALRSRKESLPRFLALASAIMLLSSICVYAAHVYLDVDESAAKLVVDFLLFFVNYAIQRSWVFVRPV